MALTNAKTDSLENGLLLLLFQNANFANIGDATGLRGSTAAGSFYVSLHTADPGEAGTQTTNEAAYVGYARIGIARTSGGFVVTANSVSPAANVTFGQCTSTPGATITHFGIGTAASGAGVLLYRGDLTPTIAMAVNVTPVILAASTIVED